MVSKLFTPLVHWPALITSFFLAKAQRKQVEGIKINLLGAMEKEENHSKKTIDSLVLEQALISVSMMSITNLLRKKERIRI